MIIEGGFVSDSLEVLSHPNLCVQHGSLLKVSVTKYLVHVSYDGLCVCTICLSLLFVCLCACVCMLMTVL